MSTPASRLQERLEQRRSLRLLESPPLRSPDLIRFRGTEKTFGDHVILHANGDVEYIDENAWAVDDSTLGGSGDQRGTRTNRRPYDGPRWEDTLEYRCRRAGYANTEVAARALGVLKVGHRKGKPLTVGQKAAVLVLV